MRKNLITDGTKTDKKLKVRCILTENGNFLCLVNGVFIFVDAEGNYLPTGFEQSTGMAIGTIVWSKLVQANADIYTMTDEGVVLAQKAIAKREEMLRLPGEAAREVWATDHNDTLKKESTVA